MNLFVNDQPRTSRTFLPLITKRRRHDTAGRRIKIGVIVRDDDRVFAAHFGDNTLDPYLAVAGFGGFLVNVQADAF